MIWDNEGNDLNCNSLNSPRKNNTRSHLTLMTSNLFLDVESNFQELLINRREKGNKIDLFSENNSLFELKNEDDDPFFFNYSSKSNLKPS